MSSGGSRIRPTSSLLRKVIFDTIRPDIGEASFLDLFAGTGSVGLESLAEGAAHCVLVERDRPTFKSLQKSIEAAGVKDSSLALCLDAVLYIKRSYSPSEFDIVFADPPYDRGYFAILIRLLFSAEMLPNRLLIAQVSKRERQAARLPQDLNYREKIVGDTVLLFARRA
ncbi:RsmD family RNA methyltransferase [bacterium]|nr:RsmD family RNA methyltransferase [bacterium]